MTFKEATMHAYFKRRGTDKWLRMEGSLCAVDNKGNFQSFSAGDALADDWEVKQPREFWVVLQNNGAGYKICNDKEEADSYFEGYNPSFLVREVMGEEK